MKDSPTPGHRDGKADVAVVDVLSQVSGGAVIISKEGTGTYFARAHRPQANTVQVC